MRGIGLAAFLVPLIGAAWTGAWFFAAREAGRQVDSWIGAEAVQGRIWTCPDRSISGYPIALVLSCHHPLFTGQAQGQGVQGSLAALNAEASLLHPRSLILDLVAPFAYRTSDARADVTGTWTSLHVTLIGLPAIRTVTMRGSNVAVDGRFGQGGHQGGHAAALDARFTLAPDQSDPTLDFAVTIGAMAMPPLDALLGGTMPADVALSGRLDQATLDLLNQM